MLEDVNILKLTKAGYLNLFNAYILAIEKVWDLNLEY